MRAGRTPSDWPAPPPQGAIQSSPPLTNQQPPSYMQDGIRLCSTMGWPNWRNLGNREWITAGQYLDPSTHRRINEIVFTGGRYEDRDGRLHAMLSQGGHTYTGTFQEYNTTVWQTRQNVAVPRRDANRIVRAITTGDVFWTNDHYSTFHYMGRH
ncbi:hypothetical protein [Streptomyces chartreusis]|uniref:hypothetical protein n=1 Tax=Streptomyces chartreusis TaxID=1969 RepID=UPI003626E9B1